jgi:LysM repeat protein
MNTQTPLSQGSLLEQKNKGRDRVKIAILFVLAIHGIGLMALLMQGCGQNKEPVSNADTNTTETNTQPAFAEPAAPPPGATSTPPVVVTTPTTPDTTAQPPQPTAGATEYTIAKGDYLEKIAKNFHVTVTALKAANPGIEPTKLKIGQKIHIPAPAPATTAPTPSATTPEAAGTSSEQIYTVKSGDTIIGIAKHFSTSAKAIMAANGLKTTSIKVGQKLKIPAKTAAPTAPAAPVAPAVPVEPAPTTTTAPTTAPAPPTQ